MKEFILFALLLVLGWLLFEVLGLVVGALVYLAIIDIKDAFK